MKKIIFILSFLSVLTGTSFACDFDGDQISDSVTKVSGRKFLISLSTGGTDSITIESPARSWSCHSVDGGSLLVKQRTGVVTYKTAKSTPRALESVCKNVRSLVRGEIWKAVASRHITQGPRAQSTSFITLKNVKAPRNSCLSVYASNGALIHKLGQYYPTGAKYSSRFYGGHGCGDALTARSVASRAQSQAGSTKVYLTSGTGNCALIPNPSVCINSSGC